MKLFRYRTDGFLTGTGYIRAESLALATEIAQKMATYHDSELIHVSPAIPPAGVRIRPLLNVFPESPNPVLWGEEEHHEASA